MTFNFSCKSKKVERSKHLTFYPNKYYNGSNDTTNMIATLYVQEKTEFLQCLIGISSQEDTATYIVKICKKDSNSPLGYDSIPFISFGSITNELPKNKDISDVGFDNLFDPSNDYYYILQSIKESSGDTTKMLIFSKLID